MHIAAVMGEKIYTFISLCFQHEPPTLLGCQTGYEEPFPAGLGLLPKLSRLQAHPEPGMSGPRLS